MKATRERKLMLKAVAHSEVLASSRRPTWPRTPWLRTRESMRENLERASLMALSAVYSGLASAFPQCCTVSEDKVRRYSYSQIS